MYPSYNVTAQVLKVVDDIAVILYVCMLDELGKVLFPNTYKKINQEDNTWKLCGHGLYLISDIPFIAFHIITH